MNTSSQPMLRRRRTLLVVVSALAIYVGSYLFFRLDDDIIHERSVDGTGTYHIIYPAMPDYRLIGVAGLLGHKVDHASDTIKQSERRRRFLAVFYAPLCFVETQGWRIID